MSIRPHQPFNRLSPSLVLLFILFVVLLFGAIPHASPQASSQAAAESTQVQKPPSTAEKSRTAEPTEAGTIENQDAKPTNSDKSKPEKRDNAEVFVPSEEISEDFAVSFPVDI